MLVYISAILLTPFLAILAVITSAITSSFLFIRLAFLAIEMISGLTIETFNKILSFCLDHLNALLRPYKTRSSSADNKRTIKKRKIPPSSICLSSIPAKPVVKSTYSVSVPGTPDSELTHRQMAI